MHRVRRLVLLLIFLIGDVTLQAATVKVDHLIEALSASDRAAQSRAIETLGELGRRAKTAVPALIKVLDSKDARQRARSAWALGRIGPAAEAAVDALARRLNDPDEKVRAHAARALGEIGVAAQRAAPALIKAAVDRSITVRREVLESLGKIHAPRDITIPLFVKTLEESDPEVLLPAVQTLAESGKEALPFLRDALKDEKACYWACLIVSEIGSDAKETVPLVTDVLQHKDPECRVEALMTLGALGSDAKSAVPRIVESLGESHTAAVRYAAAYALGKIGEKTRSRPALLKAFHSNDPQLRVIAAWSLLQIFPDDEELGRTAFKAILAALTNKNEQVRETAVRSLSELDPGDEKLREDEIAAFVQAMCDAEPKVVDAVLDGLASKKARAMPTVIRALADKRLRPYAVEVAMRIGPEAEDAVPGLINILKDPDSDNELRREVQFALGAIGPAAASAVPQLIASLASSQPDVRYSACYALGKIGEPAKAAVPVLRQHLDSDDEFMRFASVWALVYIEPKAKDIRRLAVPLLTQALQDEREHVRAEAARALGDLAADARSSLTTLRKLLDDSNPDVRTAATEAIDKIEQSGR